MNPMRGIPSRSSVFEDPQAASTKNNALNIMYGRFLLISLHNIMVFVMITLIHNDVRLQYTQTADNCQTISGTNRPWVTGTVEDYLNSHVNTITEMPDTVRTTSVILQQNENPLHLRHSRPILPAGLQVKGMQVRNWRRGPSRWSLRLAGNSQMPL